MKYDIDHEFVSISSQTATHRIILIHGWGADADDLLTLGKEIKEKLNLDKLNSLSDLYLRPLINKNIEELILGCSHYPLIYNFLRKILDSNIGGAFEIITEIDFDITQTYLGDSCILLTKFKNNAFVAPNE